MQLNTYIRNAKQAEFKHLNDRSSKMRPLAGIIPQPMTLIFSRPWKS